MLFNSLIRRRFNGILIGTLWNKTYTRLTESNPISHVGGDLFFSLVAHPLHVKSRFFVLFFNTSHYPCVTTIRICIVYSVYIKTPVTASFGSWSAVVVKATPSTGLQLQWQGTQPRWLCKRRIFGAGKLIFLLSGWTTSSCDDTGSIVFARLTAKFLLCSRKLPFAYIFCINIIDRRFFERFDSLSDHTPSYFSANTSCKAVWYLLWQDRREIAEDGTVYASSTPPSYNWSGNGNQLKQMFVYPKK